MLDTEGNRIQAHGGAIFFENDLYYWYGEDKSKTTGKNKIWSWGVRYYSSKDFYNWKDEGHLILPNENDEKSILHPAAHQLDRPHIIYNASTGKYVCWLKFSGKKDACFAVMTADRLPGPYRMVKEYFRPFGKEVGDFDLYQDEATGKTYLYFASGREGVVACTLSDNGADVEGEYKMYYTGLKPPFCREGIAIVSHEGRLFMLSSGMTGYVPNPSQHAELQSPLGEITEIGSPHKNDNSGASFNSQISAVFHHPKHPNLYIALADRWLPQTLLTAETSERILRTIASTMDKNYKSTLREKMDLGKLPFLASANTAVSDYVILPLLFEEGHPVIVWHDEWRIEDYEGGQS
jgi:hypothetical protein